MRKQLHFILRVLKLIWAAAKVWMIAWIVLLIIQSILPIATVILTRAVVNGIVVAIKGHWTIDELEALVIIAGLLVLVMIGGNIIDSLNTWIRVGQSEFVRDYVSLLIQEQAVRLDLSYYEQQDFYDLIHRVRQQAREQPLAMLQSMGALFSNLLTLIGLTALLVSYGIWLLPLLFLGALPALWSMVRFNRRMNRWRIQSTPRERRSGYYDFLLTERHPAAEIRLFDLGDYHRSLYAKLRTGLRTERLNLWREKVIRDLGATLAGFIAVGIVTLWMGWRLLIGAATLGDLSALYQIFSQIQSSLGIVVSQFGNFYQSLLFISDLFEFLDLEPRLNDHEEGEVKPLEHEIRFEHVTFRYPGSERDALKDFTMTIQAGKITSLVGVNGEGKTTLMKLLCRFYDVNEGRILWDGVDLRTLPIAGLRRQITMLFQIPYLYPEAASFNIAVGDLQANPSPEKIKAAGIASGADEVIMELPQKYDTILGKLFGGEELSVGEWQRVALARAFFREASLIILDEPTSAMDAWAEMDWLRRIHEIAQGRTMIMITHRFTTAMQGDRIFVLRDQQVIEQGTHTELLALNGYYAASWHDQMRESTTDPDIAPE